MLCSSSISSIIAAISSWCSLAMCSTASSCEACTESQSSQRNCRRWPLRSALMDISQRASNTSLCSSSSSCAKASASAAFWHRWQTLKSHFLQSKSFLPSRMLLLQRSHEYSASAFRRFIVWPCGHSIEGPAAEPPPMAAMSASWIMSSSCRILAAEDAEAPERAPTFPPFLRRPRGPRRPKALPPAMRKNSSSMACSSKSMSAEPMFPKNAANKSEA
mmetsp:Transcript_31370/g.81120  ORF Transcript_31370/g.81120 Transcript_31370/m.81120 type:complete len:218 (-) Transcript_31370:356-1009(-)